MNPEQQKIDDERKKLKKIYDCLLFTQCYSQYSKYGNYIALEGVAQLGIDVRLA